MLASRAALAAATALVATLLPAGVAHADTSAGPATHTLYDGCEEYAVDVNGAQPGAATWDLDATLYAPSGEQSAFDFEYGDGDAFALPLSFTVCAHEGVGDYRLDGTVTWYDAEYDVLATDRLDSPVTMTRQQTRSLLAVSDTTPRYKDAVRFKIRSRQQTPTGWAANAYESVALESRCGRTEWSRVRGSKTTTNAYGRASLRYRWNIRKTCKVRSVTLPTVNSAVSRSAVVTVDTR